MGHRKDGRAEGSGVLGATRSSHGEPRRTIRAASDVPPDHVERRARARAPSVSLFLSPLSLLSWRRSGLAALLSPSASERWSYRVRAVFGLDAQVAAAEEGEGAVDELVLVVLGAALDHLEHDFLQGPHRQPRHQPHVALANDAERLPVAQAALEQARHLVVEREELAIERRVDAQRVAEQDLRRRPVLEQDAHDAPDVVAHLVGRPCAPPSCGSTRTIDMPRRAMVRSTISSKMARLSSK